MFLKQVLKSIPLGKTNSEAEFLRHEDLMNEKKTVEFPTL
jgi:hypothetical protein